MTFTIPALLIVIMTAILVVVAILLGLLLRETGRANRLRQQRLNLDLRRQFMDLQLALAAHEDLANLYHRGLGGFTGLSDTEQTRFFILCGYALTHWTEVRSHARSGLVPDEYAREVINQLRDYFQYPGVQEFWKYRRHWYPLDTQALIEELIREAPEELRPIYPEAAA